MTDWEINSKRFDLEAVIEDREKELAHYKNELRILQGNCPHNVIRKEDCTSQHIYYSIKCTCEVCGKRWYETENYSTWWL